jgi:tight adherence protein B
LPDWLVGVIEPRNGRARAGRDRRARRAGGLFAGWIAALGVLFLLMLLAVRHWLRLQKFRRKLVSQLPASSMRWCG